jgi:hypothetical protein
MANDQWVPRHIEHGVIWENGILLLVELGYESSNVVYTARDDGSEEAYL